MVELHIKIRKRIARLAYGENFVSYNEGYKIIFDFDREWDNIGNKIARFIFGENYIDCPINGNEVEIPLIKNADTLEIGVYSDNLYTTTAVKFKVLKSIKNEEKIEILVPEAYPEIEELDDEDLIRVYDKSEEKIGISPLKKLFDKMGVVIDEALAAAKESGEFDGITPTIGDNGNWFLGDTDTEKPSRGADGKSAYSYAQDGGYTGTEAEFAAKLAEEIVNPIAKTADMTQPVGVDSNGQLWTAPTSGGNVDLTGYVKSVNGIAPNESGNVEISVSDGGMVSCAIPKIRINPKEPLNITTHEGGQNQPTHPKVLFFPDGWNGHKYWMVYTPYPGNNSQQENPCITYSDDGITWSEEGISNPIATAPTNGYNSDTHLIVVDNVLECWWREVVSQEEIIVRKKSTDGVAWSDREELFRTGTTTAADCLSPVVIYDDAKYKIWCAYQRRYLKYYESADGTNWQYKRDIAINPTGSSYKVWHFDIIKTAAGYEFVGCYQLNGVFDKNNFIYYSTSKNNVGYKYPVRILTNGYDGRFDRLELYRPCLLKMNDGTDHEYYNLYYGAQGALRNWAIGLVQASDIKSLMYYIEQESAYVDDYLEADTAPDDDPGGSSLPDGAVTDFDSSTWTVGYFNDSGEIVTELNYHHSSYIAMPDLANVNILHEVAATVSYIRISYFGADLNYLSASLSGATNSIKLTAVENAAYYVINANTADKSNVSVTITDLRPSISNDFDSSAWTIGYFNDDGAITRELGLHHSDYMPIKAGTVNFGSASYGRLSYFDAELNYLGFDRGMGLNATPTNKNPSSISVLTNVENAAYYVINANTADKTAVTVL